MTSHLGEEEPEQDAADHRQTAAETRVSDTTTASFEEGRGPLTSSPYSSIHSMDDNGNGSPSPQTEVATDLVKQESTSPPQKETRKNSEENVRLLREKQREEMEDSEIEAMTPEAAHAEVKRLRKEAKTGTKPREQIQFNVKNPHSSDKNPLSNMRQADRPWQNKTGSSFDSALEANLEANKVYRYEPDGNRHRHARDRGRSPERRPEGTGRRIDGRSAKSDGRREKAKQHTECGKPREDVRKRLAPDPSRLPHARRSS